MWDAIAKLFSGMGSKGAQSALSSGSGESTISAGQAASGGGFWNKLGKGAKNPLDSQGGVQNIGAFLRYMLDDEARKTAGKKTMSTEEMPSELSGKTPSKITYKKGNATYTYGDDSMDFLNNDGGDNSTKKPNGMIQMLKNMLSSQGDKMKSKGEYSVGQTINKNGKSYKVTGFDTDGMPLVSAL